MNISRILNTLLLTAALLVFSSSAHAQEQDTSMAPPLDILPATTAEERGMEFDAESHTHPAIKLTPDKSELVRLDKPAASIIIGNPNHVSILADTSKTLVIIPRTPGATHFTVLDKNGAVIMQRHIIVASPKEKYMRVRRSCAGSDDENCQTTSVFYCPDMCHEIVMGSEEDSTDSAEAAASGGPSGSDDEQEISSPPANVNDSDN